MKKVIILSLAVASANLMAETPSQPLTELKQATAFTGLGLLGLAAGGPVGLFVGAVSGAYVGEQFKKADSLDGVKQAQADTEARLLDTQKHLQEKDETLARLEASTLENLQLQILFLTGSDQLTPQGKQQVMALARFMVDNPELRIHLAGHSDPRGTDDYNDLLSHQRALGIYHALEQLGIEGARMSVSGHGSAYSQAVRGKLDSYAFDRRVDIGIIRQEKPGLAYSR